MPIYEFICKNCAKVTEVVNSIKDSDNPPELPCKCGASSWEKQISGTSYRWRYVDQEPPKKRG